MTPEQARAWLTPIGTDALERSAQAWERERVTLEPLLLRICVDARMPGTAGECVASLLAELVRASNGAPLRDVAEFVRQRLLRTGDLERAIADVPTSPPVLAVTLARSTHHAYEVVKATIERVGIDKAKVALRMGEAGQDLGFVVAALEETAPQG